MTSQAPPVSAQQPVRRFSISSTHGIRAHFDIDPSVPAASEYIARLGSAVGELLELGALRQLHIAGPGGTAVLIRQTTSMGIEITHGAVAGSQVDPAGLADDIVAQVTS